MQTIRLTKAEHEGERRIALRFDRDPDLEKLVRKLPGARWSNSLKGWHVANNPENLRLIFSTFKGVAEIDKSGIFGGSQIKRPETETPPLKKETEPIRL